MNSTASAFSSPESVSLEKQVEVDETIPATYEQIWSETQREKCLKWIRSNSLRRVCLQFPDDYLCHSEAIATSLKDELANDKELDNEVKIFILADTSYGSCCVDEIAAAHVDADGIVHFGYACRSNSASILPIFYCFPQLSIDYTKFSEYLLDFKQNFEGETVVIYLDIGYHHVLETEPPLVLEEKEESLLKMTKLEHDETKRTFLSNLKRLECKGLHIIEYGGTNYGTLSHNGHIIRKCEDFHTEIDELDESRVCVFVGRDNIRFFNLSLSTKAAKWFIYEPFLNNFQEKNPLTANYIRRRYYYIEKCKDAQTLGLIVATLSTNGYLDVVKRIQTMAKSRGIKTQIISVGRINPAKLANFLEIDCFVLIGCPFNNNFDSKEFYRPIVSVFEAEMALNPSWHARYPEIYVTDFKELLPEGRSFLEYDVADLNRTSDVSLIDGHLRVRGHVNNANNETDISALDEQNYELTKAPGMEIMSSNIGLRFEDRTWLGLDPALGRTEPAVIQKGLSGIPIRYTHE
uniref:2-(3-amino-3-carboxypropyl)histidine synthase subunit 2 n=1 Tax=Glossina morsitans morsitans TaxID=37546 RepID=A0A1B0FNA9_GLOMM